MADITYLVAKFTYCCILLHSCSKTFVSIISLYFWSLKKYQLFKNVLWVTLPWFTVAAISGQWFHQSFLRAKFECHRNFSVQMCMYFYTKKCSHRLHKSYSQIQLHLKFHKIQPLADVSYMMSANKCPHRQAGHLNVEIRLFTVLISSVNNSEECCKTS